MWLKRLLAFGSVLIVGGAYLVYAEEMGEGGGGDPAGAICCKYSIPDCAPNGTYPQCNYVGEPCDPLNANNKGYCMKS
jgi:hypothetical protein